MRKMITRAIALTVIALMAALPCMAAGDISVTDATYADGILTVEIDGYEAGEEASVLVVDSSIATAEDLATLADDDIVYVDQVTMTEATYTFEMPVDARATAVGSDAVNVFIGGTSSPVAVKFSETVNLDGSTPTPSVTYSAEITGSVFASDADALAAVKVYKTTDGVKEDITSEVSAAGGIVQDTTAKTITVTVDGSVIETFNYTIAVPGGKTGIAGNIITEYDFPVAHAAVIAWDNAASQIAGAAMADENGDYELEIAAGSYTIIVVGADIYEDGGELYTDRLTTYTAGATVVDGAMITKDVTMTYPLTGDANGDGVVDMNDYNDVTGALAA